eukprot:COSAG06_NODE_5641_length_3344_cov_22.891834_3_plen_64_part_00
MRFVHLIIRIPSVRQKAWHDMGHKQGRAFCKRINIIYPTRQAPEMSGREGGGGGGMVPPYYNH